MKEMIRKAVEKYFPSPNEIFHRNLYCEVASVVETNNVTSLLDLGCGDHSPVGPLKRAFGRRLRAVGVDIWRPSITKSRKLALHDRYIQSDILAFDAPEGSFDIVVLLDVIEHFARREGLILLQNIEKIFSQKAIVYTPHGYLWQAERDANPYQKHGSGWKVSDFVNRGYEVRGIGLRASLRTNRDARAGRGQYTSAKRRPSAFFGLLALLGGSIVLDHPSLSQALFCVKNKP